MPFYHQPHPWNPGYAIPKYVLAEPPGRGTFTTKWLPRRTISNVVPDYLAKPTGRELLDRPDAALDGLGADPYVLPDPGGRLEIGPGGPYETLGGFLEDHKGKLMLGAAALAAWLMFRKKRRNPPRRRRRSRRRR